mmetsp:Transcript_19373/g.22150  ORF Transcript_19373/g.22150 Transcript_19373/m.22150 type:complete len:129 (-) Transcript_19373:29-415(-)
MLASKTEKDIERQLMIKVKSCERLTKEVAFYVKDLEKNETKLEKMKEENKNVYDVKMFEEVVRESRIIIPDSERRLEESLDALTLFLDATAGLNTESDLYLKAREFAQAAPSAATSVETRVDENTEVF